MFGKMMLPNKKYRIWILFKLMSLDNQLDLYFLFGDKNGSFKLVA